MDTAKVVESILVKLAAAKFQHSEAMGTRASWTMEDQTKLAARSFAEVLGCDEEVAGALFKQVYNQSAVAQKLGEVEAFKSRGHFQRVSREKKAMSGFEEMLGGMGIK